jgi:ATP-dependent metalloprotease
MVTSFGMSPALGNVDLASNHDKLSTETKNLIEQEVRRVIEEGRVRATNLIASKRKELDLLARALVDYETLNKEEAFKVVRGEKLEGKLVMPRGPTKLPEVGPISGGRIPEVPDIPGSSSSDNDGPPPSSGGAIA